MLSRHSYADDQSGSVSTMWNIQYVCLVETWPLPNSLANHIGAWHLYSAEELVGKQELLAH